jgi:cAMP-dependent protein kinase regulator
MVKEAAIKRMKRYEDILKRIKILSSIDDYERSKIAEAIKQMKFKKDEYVIRQGDKGDCVYFIESGKAIATKSNSILISFHSIIDGNEETVYEYKDGDYFGELALLKDEPRAANIKATVIGYLNLKQ